MKKRYNFHLNYTDLIIGFIVLLLILNSKTVYFGEINRSTCQYLLFIVSALSVFFLKISKRQIKYSIVEIIIFIVLFIFNILLYSSTMKSNQINQVLGYILTFICVFVLASLIPKEHFSKWYVLLMNIMCLISLPCVLLSNLNQNLALTFCQPGYDWQTPFGYSFFYTWGVNGVINLRNSGMFWEPGAFQGFIIIGILILLFNTHNNEIKKIKEIFIIFIVTLLTTQSSTGYFLLVLILLVFNKRVKLIFQGLNIKRYRKIFAAVFCSIILFLALSSGNIGKKLFSDQTGSTLIRFNDVIGGFSLILKGGLFGLGETDYRSAMRLLYGVNFQDSVGLFSMAYTFGIIFSITYIISFYRGIIRFFNDNNYLEQIVLTAMFILLHMTEGLWFLPIYLYFLFYRNNQLCLGRQ